MINSYPKSLYIHIPFCDNICGYCDFFRVKHNNKLVENWLNTLATEISATVKTKELDTIYLGGGTPSCLSLKQLRKLLEIIKPYSLECIEYTIEVNPESITKEKIALLKSYGINRVSMGVQSTSVKLLNEMNRKHTNEQVTKAIEQFKLAKIDNISLDFIYSLPNQTMNDIENTLKQFKKWDVTHISIYSLTIEKGSQFYRDSKDKLDDETEADMYEYILKTLDDMNFERYEISSFCKNNKKSLHNLCYWNDQDFYGISIGASSKINGVRYDNTTNFIDYFNNLYKKDTIILNDKERKFEAIMMGLRLVDGININAFNKKYNTDLTLEYKEPIRIAKENKWITCDENLKCTKKGLDLCNSVVELFYI